jgi:hypothetical protein
MACPYNDVARLYAEVVDVDVAIFYWLTVSESDYDTWQILGKWHGATWPNHGLPRGTLLLTIGFGVIKSFCGRPDSNR